jgi:hypothetical protein
MMTKCEHKNDDGTFVGGYDGCVMHMVDCEGHDKESAQKICGKIAAEKGRARPPEKDEIARSVPQGARPVDCDVAKRQLRGVIFVTDSLASDGWILRMAGVKTAKWERDPVVLAKHDAHGVAIGRAVDVKHGEHEKEAVVEFADTALGRDYAYLYGVNADAQPYMRGWSVRGPILERTTMSWEEARREAGNRWDADLAATVRREQREVRVATAMEVTEFSAIALGADKAALTRAYDAGCETAGALLTRTALADAEREIEVLRLEQRIDREALRTLRGELKALRGEVDSAARRRNSESLLTELRTIATIARG